MKSGKKSPASKGKASPPKRGQGRAVTPRKKPPVRKPPTANLAATRVESTLMEAPRNAAPPRSLPRLREILGEYYQPVVDYQPIGNRVPFAVLTRRINREWNLTGDRAFRPGEINAGTVVIALAAEIDRRAGL